MSDETRRDRRDAGETADRADDRDERMEGEMSNDRDTIDSADAVPPDDLLDARIARLAAAHYHRPPDIVPRDAMWDAIVARRGGTADASTPAAMPAAPPAVQRLEVARTGRRGGGGGAWGGRTAWWLAAAASLTLATGVGIGRWWSVSTGSFVAGRDSAETAPVALGTPDDRAPRGDERGAGATRAESTVARDAVRRAPDGLPLAVAPSDGRARSTARSSRSTSPRDPDVAYQLATLRHLTEVEALLVSYRDDSADVALDEKLADWSRRLLDETRLLLDSPAAEDPRRRRLLEDLELVLVQMTSLERSTPDRERPLIDETLRHSQLMPRLRAAVPAGATDM